MNKKLKAFMCVLVAVVCSGGLFLTGCKKKNNDNTPSAEAKYYTYNQTKTIIGNIEELFDVENVWGTTGVDVEEKTKFLKIENKNNTIIYNRPQSSSGAFISQIGSGAVTIDGVGYAVLSEGVATNYRLLLNQFPTVFQRAETYLVSDANSNPEDFNVKYEVTATDSSITLTTSTITDSKITTNINIEILDDAYNVAEHCSIIVEKTISTSVYKLKSCLIYNKEEDHTYYLNKSNESYETYSEQLVELAKSFEDKDSTICQGESPFNYGTGYRSYANVKSIVDSAYTKLRTDVTSNIEPYASLPSNVNFLKITTQKNPVVINKPQTSSDVLTTIDGYTVQINESTSLNIKAAAENIVSFLKNLMNASKYDCFSSEPVIYQVRGAATQPSNMDIKLWVTANSDSITLKFCVLNSETNIVIENAIVVLKHNTSFEVTDCIYATDNVYAFHDFEANKTHILDSSKADYQTYKARIDAELNNFKTASGTAIPGMGVLAYLGFV